MTTAVLDREVPYRVTAPDGKVHLVVMNATDGLPAAFALMGARADKKVAIRLSGGCKGMSSEDKEQMLDFFAAAFVGYKGVVGSGATRQVSEDGLVDPMVTEVPGVIAALNPGSVALGTVPRTEMLSLQGDSRIVLDQWGTVLSPSMSGILVVQNGPEGEMGWDGDLNIYFKLMQDWKTYGGFTALGMIGWNGGAITKDELERAIKLGWPTFLIKGSGRATDELIGEITTSGDTIDPKTFVIEKDNPEILRDLLIGLGFIDR